MTRRKKMKTEEPSAAAATVDRISQLPDEIIHHILQSLPCQKKAAQTSVLSERWLQLWRSYPVVDNHRCKFKNFERFAVATSKRLLHERSVPLILDSLNVTLLYLTNRRYDLSPLLSSASLLDDDSGSSSSRSPLKVVVKICPCNKLMEGGNLLDCCGRTKFLDLQGFDLSRFRSNKANFRYNLQELTLQHVRVSEESFLRCLANAPLLEKLTLTWIYGIHSLDISASNFPNLKSLSFHGYVSNVLEQLQLSSAPLLQTLIFWGKCKFLNVVSAPNVKFLELQPCGKVSRREFDDLISKFPSLESLHVDMMLMKVNDDGLRISTRTLRKLTLKQWQRHIKIEIDGPNLATLFVTGYDLPMFLNIVNVPFSCQYITEYCPLMDKITSSWFITKLRKYLSVLTTRSYCHQLVFKLVFAHTRELLELDLSQVGCVSSPLPVQHLQLGTDLPLDPVNIAKHAGRNRLIDGILCTFHPKTLSVTRLPHSRHDRSLFSYISREIEMENLQGCCSSGKCWRRRFKEAKITSLTVDDLSTMNQSTISQQSINMIISFRGS